MTDQDLKEVAKKMLLSCVDQFVGEDGRIYASCPWLMKKKPEIFENAMSQDDNVVFLFDYSESNEANFILNSQYIACTEVV
jgi:hypothetical protein